mmetsp:Transcript_32367/g.62209  ORF Transcript_32367/g.62209 Transcript_32367/m.62209 type:complete len:226 (-) Transcript_32367:3044-3721(-)|eukprot:CAMPEP_0114293076 /NCGR_PEP_ID=MMETSP0059-20121206/9404_1 /TAXON_ID=36894 /ORGANISM="Pyramimonas parkeae, Strain CCMP726" /LENGTH=225 /DNA_ID=CAMNT_0001414771 /DNA_START=128 /DNA_END=805 /DNA_ORIENTATION=-
MGNPVPMPTPGGLDGYKLDISHQEMDRIVGELEAIYGSQPTAWLPVESIGMMLTHELGYEDLEEFEDAIKTTFPEFLAALPHIEVAPKEQDPNILVFRVKPPPPEEEQVPTQLSFRITTRKDLWRVCLKAPNATVVIPELEFEIGADSKRKIDSLYNHIAGAVFNLSTYVRSNAGLPESDQEKISAAVDGLTKLLDVEKPWTWVLKDPQGLSDIKPADGVEVSRL